MIGSSQVEAGATEPILSEPALAAATDDVIGEVPLWDVEAGAVTWIDVLKPGFHRLEPATGCTKSWQPPEKFGCYCLAGAGRYLTAGRGGIAVWTPEDGHFDRLCSPEADRPENILNDGRCDPAGRLLVGSMNRMLERPSGRLWQVGAGGEAVLMYDGLWLPNALCWSPDGTTFYLGDSHTNQIHAFDYDRRSGTLGTRRLFADTTSLPGMCDGASVDAEGYLWNARFGGKCLVRFAPDGSVDRIIPMPVTNPTHIAFGGPDLRMVFVTTGHFRLPEVQLAAEPLSGGLLVMTSSVPGLPEPRWAG